MAQDVTVAGAAYSDVPAVALPATGGGTAEFYDVSATTATAEDVASGKTFYSASGALTTGTASGGGDGVGVFYGTCATAAATAAKAVVCEDFTSDHLVKGTVVIVKFANAQTYNGAPTLNVQSTGAKTVKRIGTTNAARYEWQAGEVVQFVYDGTYWVLTDGGIATTTYYGVTKLSSATNSTSTALAATASAVKAAYDHASSKQDALVSGTNIKTVNGQSLLGAGDVDTSYTLPTASTTTLGGVKVDGETITITDGVISSSGGGGGGNNGMTFFVSSVNSPTGLYIDSALTTTVLEHYGYDLDAAWADIGEASSIRIIQGYGTSNMRVCYVTDVVYDKPEDSIEIGYFIRSGTYRSTSIM